MFEFGNENTDVTKVIVWIILAPFSLFWIFHRSLLAAFLLEAVVITIVSFVFGIKIQKQWQNIRRPWFIKSILISVCLVHPLFLAIAWYLDVNYPVLVTGWGSIFVTGFVAGVIEMIIVGEMTKYFRSIDANEG